MDDAKNKPADWVIRAGDGDTEACCRLADWALQHWTDSLCEREILRLAQRVEELCGTMWDLYGQTARFEEDDE